MSSTQVGRKIPINNVQVESTQAERARGIDYLIHSAYQKTCRVFLVRGSERLGTWACGVC